MPLTIDWSDWRKLGKNITVVGLVGADGGGKSDGASHIAEVLTDRGFKVVLGLEAAEYWIKVGLNPKADPLVTVPAFQEAVFTQGFWQQEACLKWAKEFSDKGKKVILVIDRPLLDFETFMNPDDAAVILKKYGITREEALAQCDVVINLVTTAIGAEAAFHRKNKAKRMDRTLEEVRWIHKRTQETWNMHPRYFEIDNSTDFEGKKARLISIVMSAMGLPVLVKQKERFSIQPIDLRQIPVKYVRQEIRQDYLSSQSIDEKHWVESRQGESGSFYYYGIEKTENGNTTESKKIIGKGEYQKFLALRREDWRTVERHRITFYYRKRDYGIDILEKPYKGLWLLETTRSMGTSKITKYPSFIQIIKEVTGEKMYTDEWLAKDPNVK